MPQERDEKDGCTRLAISDTGGGEEDFSGVVREGLDKARVKICLLKCSLFHSFATR